MSPESQDTVGTSARSTRKGLFDDPKNGRRLLLSLYVACGLTLVAEVIARLTTHGYDHMHFAFENWFGWNAVWGFVTFALLVATARLLGAINRRPEDFYDDTSEEAHGDAMEHEAADD